jgi:hypothetical protein
LDAQQGIESNEINKWKEVYDLPQQQKIREDCQTLAGNFFFDQINKNINFIKFF